MRASSAQDQIHLGSPDGRISVDFWLEESVWGANTPCIACTLDGLPILLPSTLGLQMANGVSLTHDLAILRSTPGEHRGEWHPLYGECSTIPDNYDEALIELRHVKSGWLINLCLRTYNEGIAFRYEVPFGNDQQSFVIQSEHSRFALPPGCIAWAEQGAEGEYIPVPLESLPADCERPLTIQYPHGKSAAVAEANLTDYARMLLSPVSEMPNVIEGQLSGLIDRYEGYFLMGEGLSGEQTTAAVRGATPFVSPWRVLILGDTPRQVAERNYLIANLCPPTETADTSWIVPGKILRDMGISTPSAKQCIDIAAALDFTYILIDAGWYGDPFDDACDATRVANPIWFWGGRIEPDHPGLDIEEIARYGDERGIGIFLYVDRRHVERQLDAMLPIYKRWGIKGIKFGFVNTGPQYWMEWLVDAIRKCAGYEILLNIHDAYRPTGLSRTFPNLLTVEGIRGNEHMPSARHNATLTFTRFVAGAGDYTICYYTPRKQTTFAHQLAMSVIVYSPLQTIFWYDRPEDFGNEVELDFIRRLPTTWDDTCILAGEIGEYCVTARRKGEEWFVGCITNEQPRMLHFTLDFLSSASTYDVTTYIDSTSTTLTGTGVVQDVVRGVSGTHQITLDLCASGGAALHIVPSQLQ